MCHICYTLTDTAYQWELGSGVEIEQIKMNNYKRGERRLATLKITRH